MAFFYPGALSRLRPAAVMHSLQLKHLHVQQANGKESIQSAVAALDMLLHQLISHSTSYFVM